MTDLQKYDVSVSGRTYFTIVLPDLEALDLPAPLIMRAGRGAQARFTGLTYEQAFRLGEHCKLQADRWATVGSGHEELSAADRILARVFERDGIRVHDQIQQQQDEQRGSD